MPAKSLCLFCFADLKPAADKLNKLVYNGQAFIYIHYVCFTGAGQHVLTAGCFSVFCPG